MNDTLLVDTDVASDLFKRRARADQYKRIIHGKRLALSFMSVAELYKWSVKRKWSQDKMRVLEDAIKLYLVIPYDHELARMWGRITAECEAFGRTIPPSDAWVAATAIRHDLPLLTNNARHFEAAEEHCGLKLLRPEA